jgi:hypothetical protein
MNLDQELAPATFHQFQGGGALGDLDPGLGVDLNCNQAIRIEDALDALDGTRGIRVPQGQLKLPAILVSQRHPEIVGGFDEPADLAGQRLQIEIDDKGERGGGEGGDDRQREGEGLKEGARGWPV